MSLQPWSNPEYINDANRQLGVSMEDAGEYVTVDGDRFHRIMRRVSELKLIDPSTLNHEAAQEAFKDARRAAELLISDRLRRRGWMRKAWHSVFGL